MNPKILIIDDQKEIALVMQEFLDDQGYKTAVAMNGHDAIAKCRKEKFDLLLTDIMLPDIDGRVVVEKCLAILPGLKILFVTGYSKNLELKIGPRLQLIKKPCKPSAILAKIEEILR